MFGLSIALCLRRNWIPKQSLFFSYWLLRCPVSKFTPFPTESVRLPLVSYPSLCSTCMTYRTPCHSIGHQLLPTQPLTKAAEDFPRGGKHSKYVPLLTVLIMDKGECRRSAGINFGIFFVFDLHKRLARRFTV